MAGASAADRTWFAPLRWPSWLQRGLDALWIALLALAVAAPACALLFAGRTQSISDGLVSVGLATDGQSGKMTLVPRTSEARRAGIRLGDEPIAVNGHPVSSALTVANLEKLSNELEGADGSALRLRVRSTGGEVTDRLLVRHSGTVKTLPGIALNSLAFSRTDAFVAALTTGFLITAAILLFRQRRRQWIAGLLSFALLMIAAGDIKLLYLQFGAFRVGGFLDVEGLTLLTLVLFVFPDGRFAYRWTLWAAVPAVILGTLSASGLASVVLFTAGLESWAPAIAEIGLAFRLVAVGALVWRYLRLPPNLQRQQLGWAILGFAVGVVLLLPAYWLNGTFADEWMSSIPWDVLERLLRSLALIAFASGLLISLLKYRLYDAEAVIARSAAYGVLTFVFLALFAGSERVIEILGEEYFGEKLGALAGGIGAAFAAIMLVPLHHRLTHWAEHKFQKQLIRLKHGLPLLVGDMRETAPVARIAAATLDSVTHGVRASRAALVLDGALLDARGIEAGEVERWRQGRTPPPHDGFDIDKADPLFPLRVPLAADGHGRIGWLLLGPRPDGSFYSKDERETLAAIADPVARALEIAAAREKREAEERELWRDQKALNQQLLRASEESIRVFSEVARKLDRLIEPPGIAAE